MTAMTLTILLYYLYNFVVIMFFMWLLIMRDVYKWPLYRVQDGMKYIYIVIKI